MHVLTSGFTNTRDFLRANVVLERNRSGSGTQVEKEQGFCLEGSSVRLARAQKSRIHAGEQQNRFRRLLNIQITVQTETETERDVHENTASHSSTYLQTVRAGLRHYQPKNCIFRPQSISL